MTFTHGIQIHQATIFGLMTPLNVFRWNRPCFCILHTRGEKSRKDSQLKPQTEEQNSTLMGVGEVRMCVRMCVRVRASTPHPACCVWLTVHRTLPVKHGSTPATPGALLQAGGPRDKAQPHNTKIIRRNTGRPFE